MTLLKDKFVSGSYKLVGEHLTNDDKDKILLHRTWQPNTAGKGDKVKLDSNIYDADNEKKGVKETVEVTIKGLFDGHNKSQ